MHTHALMSLSLVAMIIVPAPTRQKASEPAQIILIRHGEKPDNPDDPDLSAAGRARAQALVGFLTTDPVMAKFGPPVAIFATGTTQHDDGVRTQETVAPLAKALKLPVQTPVLGKDYAAIPRLVLGNPNYAGKTIVICWNHEDIPQLAAALGVRPEPPPWKGRVFDRVYLITYRAGKATLTDLPERLARAR